MACLLQLGSLMGWKNGSHECYIFAAVPPPWFSTQGKTVMHMTQTIPKFNYLIIFFELLKKKSLIDKQTNKYCESGRQEYSQNLCFNQTNFPTVWLHYFFVVSQFMLALVFLGKMPSHFLSMPALLCSCFYFLHSLSNISYLCICRFVEFAFRPG